MGCLKGYVTHIYPLATLHLSSVPWKCFESVLRRTLVRQKPIGNTDLRPSWHPVILFLDGLAIQGRGVHDYPAHRQDAS